MSMQPVVHSRSSSNGYGRRKIEKDSATRPDNKSQTVKTISTRTSIGRGETSCERLVYITTCLIGHQVEVQVEDGSLFSGIFHGTNAEDFGIVLKMANQIRDGSQGQKIITESPSKPHSRTLIIPAKDLVQVIGKGVPLYRDELITEPQHEVQLELMTDSCISQSRHVEVGRELGRWVPDENDPGYPELENVFDSPWNRGWDQFAANATLFGVKSTFNEELYTTKLDRGPQTREMEREAMRIAREIEGENTLDLHLAEERGIQLDGNLEIDEETRFSAVFRGVDDSGYDEIEDILLDSQNDETFGDVSESTTDKPLIDGVAQSSVACRNVYGSVSGDHARQLPKHSSVIDDNRLHDNQPRQADGSYTKEDREKQKLPHLCEVSKADDPHSLPRLKKESFDKAGLSPKVTASDPSHTSSKINENTSSSTELSEGVIPPKTQGPTSSLVQLSSSASYADQGGAAATSAGRGMSPSSSLGSLSSEKSKLNPHAKEFKFNPNAKSFIPSQTPLRPSSPMAESPFYYPANMTAAVPHMHGMPIGIGMGPTFAAQQPVIFNPQAAPMPHPYYHANGPQQMIMGQPRPVLYMPSYPQGREF